MRKLLLGALLVSGALCASAAPVDMRLRAPWHPNVLFILCDDIRCDALGYAGHPYLKTPNIDRIAHEGVQFKNTFCTTSLCSPSRASHDQEKLGRAELELCAPPGFFVLQIPIFGQPLNCRFLVAAL